MTFFFMGMNIPIQKSEAIIKERNIFKRRKSSSSSNSGDEQDDEFLIRLSATVEKIKAYKNYFYNNDKRIKSKRVSTAVDPFSITQKPPVLYPFLKLVNNK